MADIEMTSEDKWTGLSLQILTASKLAITDSNGDLTQSTVTSTEAGYLAGVTSAIQTQVDLKAPSASPSFTGTITVNQIHKVFTGQTTTTSYENVGAVTLDDTKVYLFDAYFVGRKSDGTDRIAAYHVAGAYREGGSATLITGAGTQIYAEAGSANPSVQIAVSGNDVKLQATGNIISAETWNWIVFVTYRART